MCKFLTNTFFLNSITVSVPSMFTFQMWDINDNALQLCWECERHIRKWTKFKKQVRHAYKNIHNFEVSLN